MSPLEIRSGLRKLEFQASRDGSEEGERALVEFVYASRLPAEQTVLVPLGVRAGVLRQLVGRPTLVEEQSKGGKVEYYYRLQGAIAKAPPKR